jgi:hypothetical protein
MDAWLSAAVTALQCLLGLRLCLCYCGRARGRKRGLKRSVASGSTATAVPALQPGFIMAGKAL